MQGGAPKAAGHNGWRQITRPSREMGAGLKILVSAVQSRPSPPFDSRYSEDLHSVEFQQRLARPLHLAY